MSLLAEFPQQVVDSHCLVVGRILAGERLSPEIILQLGAEALSVEKIAVMAAREVSTIKDAQKCWQSAWQCPDVAHHAHSCATPMWGGSSLCGFCQSINSYDKRVAHWKDVGPTGVGFSGGNFRGTQVCIHGGNFSARQICLWWRAVEALERFASVREPEPSPWPLSTILFSFLTCTLTLASISC
jgi:hypothetical protein